MTAIGYSLTGILTYSIAKGLDGKIHTESVKKCTGCDTATWLCGSADCSYVDVTSVYDTKDA